MAFDRLPAGPIDALERAVLSKWEEEELFHQTVAATASGDPFVFYEGPPTANGRPGIHHVFARTIKDLICRFRTMQGRSVTRIAGWDTHGLPVEISVERELDISGKADIESFGVAEFNARCRESVFRYKADWEELSNRIGYWLDYDHPYVTYTNDYIESVWWLLKQLWEKDLLYEGHKVLPYCPRCGTSLSSHELALGYATHKSPSIYVLFELVDSASEGARRHLLVWTTTPWTLPSNVAVAVHPDFEYVELDVDGTRIIVESSIARTLVVPGATRGNPIGDFPTIATFKGTELIGQRYRQLADAVDIDASVAFRVVTGDFVTSEEGTGIVHMAPAFGADDFETIRREGLAFVNPVDEEGRFVDTGWDNINGKTVFEANDTIAERLRTEGKIFGRYDPKGYEHTYPFCWRCDSPLIYYARQSWFVRTTAYAQQMLEFNAAINWNPPEVGQGRFGEWLENNVDWALSRDRYWGTPLPVWICDAEPSHVEVIGSLAELSERWGQPIAEGFDPHKPFIDEVMFTCRQCAGVMRRVPAVIDAWFDSGAMPFAQWHYPFENQQEFERHFPADYICEGLDQTRGWFYSLLAISSGVLGKTAYHNVIVNGLLLDAQGRKMSKRLGNVVDPWDAVSEFGADAVRIYLLSSSQVWLPKLFDVKTIPEVAFGFLNRLRNTYDFLAQYSEGWTPSEADLNERELVDVWLMSRLDGVIETVNRAWDQYDVRRGVRAIVEFCDNDLSNWYVRINRARFWVPDGSADPVALATLWEVLRAVTCLLAPAAPFLSDVIHRRLTGTSVHLATFPTPRGVKDDALDAAMDATRRLASLGRNARDAAGIRVRQPLAEMLVAVPSAVRGEALDRCFELLAKEVNVKAVRVVESDVGFVTLKAKPNFRTLGKVYGKATPKAAQAAARLTADQLRALEDGVGVSVEADGDAYQYRPEDIVVERELSSEWPTQSEGPFVVALDPTLSEELKREGLAREIVNRVQRIRKDAGYDFRTRIELSLSGPEDALAAGTVMGSFIQGETLARRLVLGEDVAEADVVETVDIDGLSVVVSMKRFEGIGSNGN